MLRNLPWEALLRAPATEIVAKIALIVVFLVLGLDMGGQAGFRNILVPACLIVIFVTKRVRLETTLVWWIGLFVLYPSVSLMVGIEGGGRIDVAISQYQATVLSLVLYLAIRQFDYRFSSEAAFLSIAGVAAVAATLSGLMYFGFGYFDEMLRRWHENSAGYFGMRLLAGQLFPNVYFKSTLFFVPAFLYLLYRRHWMGAVICFLGLVAGISKTGIIICLLFLIFYALYAFDIWRRLVILGLAIIAVLGVFITPVGGEILALAAGGGETVDVRVGHVTSLVGLFSREPLGFLFGFGLGSEFYSAGVSDYVTNIEVDHLNVIRKYGILWFLGFLLFVLLVIVRACCSVESRVRILGWTLLVAFVVCGTNPVLISPFFFVLLSLACSAIEQLDKGKDAK